MFTPRVVVLAAAALGAALPLSAQQLVLEDLERLPHPVVSEASDEAVTAVARFQFPADLKASLWAAEPMLANPVAIAFDEKGRLFVSETYRYRSSVLDIRGYMGMLEQDLALRTVEQREQMLRDVFGEQASQLAIESELVRLIEDRTGDGVADHSTIFADGFNTKLDGIASGVIARRGKVWFTNIPSLWLLQGEPEEGITPSKATRRQELLGGFGVRYGYTGHDFHGLAFGPDGKLYYTIGDRGVHVPTHEGGVVALPDTGAIFRSNFDGTEMEVVATGLRNPQEIAFDEYGNLFTGDNDADAGDLERLVYVVEGGDYGWRVGYQHPPLGNGGPWMSERLWLPRFPNQAAYVLPPVCNIEDGPSGLTYYPGTGLTPAYRGHFFITHFKGSITRSGVFSYQVEQDGAHFRPTASSLFIGGLLPTDVTFGPDGRFYVADWVEGWPKSSKGRIYAFSAVNPRPEEVAQQRQVQQLIAEGVYHRPPAELIELLGHADQRIRLEAQYELADRGIGSIRPLQQVARSSVAPVLARLHAMWGLGQLARTHPQSVEPLLNLLTEAEPEVRAQAAKVLGDARHHAAATALVERLQDDEARVRFFAAQSLGKLRHRDAAPALLEYLRRNDNKDAYERHAAVHALEQLGATPALAAAVRDPSPAVRLGALLVYRRLQDATAAQFLRDGDPYIVREAARAINDAPIDTALPALADRLEGAPLDDEVLMLRVLNAHFRVGRETNARALAAVAARSDAPDQFRVEALAQLALWGAPPARDRIVGVYRPLPDRAPDAAVAALAPLVPQLLQDNRTVQQQTLATIQSLRMKQMAPHVREFVTDTAKYSASRAEALNVLEALEDPELLPVARAASQSRAPSVRLAALSVLARLAPREALPVIEQLATTGNAAEQRGAFNALARLDIPEATGVLVRALEQFAKENIHPSAQFELLEVAERHSDPAVQAMVEKQKQRWAEGDDPLAPFRGALAGGDVRRGSRVFFNHPVMACVRCHQVDGSGGDAGPDLTTIGAERTPEHLLESVIFPSAHITPGFDMVSVTLRNGNVEAGTVLEETNDLLLLRRPDGADARINRADIRQRESAPSSMPEIYAHVLSRPQLRDLIAYLVNLNDPEPPIDDGPRALRTGRPEDEEGRGDERVLEYRDDTEELEIEDTLRGAQT
jgi:quinoprotein glucose dehydrogenase